MITSRVIIHWFVCVLISGEVVLLSDYTVCRQGDELTPEQVRILVSVFNIVIAVLTVTSMSKCITAVPLWYSSVYVCVCAYTMYVHVCAHMYVPLLFLSLCECGLNH